MKARRAKERALITNSRWLAYATAGAASAFAGANSAEASIHYSGPINRVFDDCLQTVTYQLDRPGDFIRLRHFVFGCSYSGSNFFNVGGLAGRSIAGIYNSCSVNPVLASKLERGQLVSNRHFVPAQSQSAVLGRMGACHGQFVGRGTGYIGFKFNNGAGDQYGWARIETRRGIKRNFILGDFAYGDVGDQIRAGQRFDNDGLGLNSLGGLALGAVGLLAWCRRRAV